MAKTLVGESCSEDRHEGTQERCKRDERTAKRRQSNEVINLSK